MNRCPVDLFNRGANSVHVVYQPELSLQQAETLRLVRQGYGPQQISEILDIKLSVAKTRVNILRDKEVI